MLPLVLPAQQQPVVRVQRTSDWSETRQDGRCAIRVMVDNTAEVELRWDQLLVRTVAGRAARDAGSQCNAPLPQGGVTNFQFQGIDGAGSVQLIEQPSANNGWAAVVRIQDPEGGEHQYTFGMTWNWDGTTPRSQTDPWNRNGNLGGRRGRGQNNPQRACRDALADRVLQDWRARVVNYGRTGNDGNWSSAGTSTLQGQAQISNGNEQRQIQYTCVVNVNDGSVQQVNYNFQDNPFNSGRNRQGNLGQTNGASNNVVTACQNEVRNRVSQQHGNAWVDFRMESRKWWENNQSQQRVNGRARVTSNGGNATIEYNCRAASNNAVQWADFKVVEGSL
jgi:hypothetical protein